MPTRSSCGLVRLLRALQADLRVGDLQARLVDIGAIGQGVGDQILHGADFIRRGDGQGVGGDDVGAGTSGSSLPRRVITFLKMASCSSRRPRALIRS